MDSLKLIYFKMRALAEAPLMLMTYTDLKFKYLMAWEYFSEEWEIAKLSIPFKQLPILVVDDNHKIAQSTSILRFIQKSTNL